ncbi:MAG: hypothetical protein ACI4D8_00305 [Wujia sp.]
MRLVSEEYEKNSIKQGTPSGGFVMSRNENISDPVVSKDLIDNEEESIYSNISHEERLELVAMDRKKRRLAKKAHFIEETKDMDKSHKIEYFFSYYKWYILAPLLALFIVAWIIIIIYQNSRPIGLSYAIVNSEDQDLVNTDFYEDYAKYFELSKTSVENSSLNYYIDYDYYKAHESALLSNDISDYYLFSNNCAKGDYDIVITDENGLNYSCYVGIIKPLPEYFEQDIFEIISDNVVYVKDYYGDTLPYAIDVTGTEFAKKLNTGYSNMYIIFPGTTTSNYNNACRFITYLTETNQLP